MVDLVKTLTKSKGKISFYHGKNIRDKFWNILYLEPVLFNPLNIRAISYFCKKFPHGLSLKF
jgi:hypothetical protein